MLFKLWNLILITLVSMFACIAGCTPNNDKNVTCTDYDCAQACIEQGFISGECVDDSCVCEGSDNPYEWETDDTKDTDSKDAGSKDAGSKDAGSKDAGSKDAGSKDAGSNPDSGE